MTITRVYCESCRDDLDWEYVKGGLRIEHHAECQPANAIVETDV